MIEILEPFFFFIKTIKTLNLISQNSVDWRKKEKNKGPMQGAIKKTKKLIRITQFLFDDFSFQIRWQKTYQRNIKEEKYMNNIYSKRRLVSVIKLKKSRYSIRTRREKKDEHDKRIQILYIPNMNE